MNHGHYGKFVLSLVISFLTMYAAMFLNVDEAAHVRLSATRAYMSLLMVTPMAVSMLLLMWSMYPKRGLNYLILAGSVAIFAVSLVLLRTQTPVADVQYMKAMIPHHSSAIMTSRHAHLRDPDVQRLSKQIIESQEREITEMNALIQRLETK